MRIWREEPGDKKQQKEEEPEPEPLQTEATLFRFNQQSRFAYDSWAAMK